MVSFDPAASASEGCAFCKIVRGEAEAAIVLEDAVSLAFLDRRPLFPGHCLLIPKRHYETLGDLPAALVAPLFTDLQRLARAVEEGAGADGTFVAINNKVSQSVPHLHVHVVPRRRHDGLKGFFWPRQQYSDERALRAMQEAIRTALARIQATDGQAHPAS
jgi:histidine triad (HIT) family protein